jgi:hypothetical protein
MGILENWNWVFFLTGAVIFYFGYRMGRHSTAPKHFKVKP